MTILRAARYGAVLLAVTATTMGVVRAQTGRIAYVKSDGAYTQPAAAGAGRASRLPKGERAVSVTLSPDGKTAVYAVAPKGNAGQPRDAEKPDAWRMSRAPFSVARPLPASLTPDLFLSSQWSPNGKTLYLWEGDDKGSVAYEPATGLITRPRGVTGAVRSVSADGGIVAYLGASDVRVRSVSTGKEKILAASGRPGALLAALKRARNPARLQDLTADIGAASHSSSSDWSFGTPALSPNGKTAFFACNLGTGLGASGNASFCFFAADIATGKLSVLSKLDAFFGRVPYDMQVSPDGARLLFTVSQHDSAFNNPSQVYVVTLQTQQKRELLYGGPQKRPGDDDSNLLEGACWSPDGKYVAVSVNFYNLAKLMALVRKQPEGTSDLPVPETWTLNLYNVRTGRIARRIPGARQPSWGR